MKKKKSKAWPLILDAVTIIAGSMIYAVSINAFTAPNNIAPGGLTGIATMLNYMFGTPIGLVIILLNIPIMLWAVYEIGYKLVTKTLIAVLVSSVCIDLFALFIPAYKGDNILVSVFAGVLQGLGLSLVFLRGATTGGTDMIARLINHRYRHLPMGKLMMVVDGIIVVISAFVFKSIESAMYACIVIFLCASLIDSILYGADSGNGKTFFIISSKAHKIGGRIITELERGVTYIPTKGGYSEQPGDMLLCAVRRFEVFRMNTIIREEDKDAFVIVGDAREISGEGFRAEKADDKSLKEFIRKKRNNE